MNLADAIRRASQANVRPGEETAIAELTSKPAKAEHNGDAPQEYTIFDELALEAHASDRALGEPNSGGLIRMELFLPPDQLPRLFRYVAATQNSVMTLREAASHLRIPAARLEQLAAERRIPAFQIDGKWRFSRGRLEEWLAQNPNDKEHVS